MHNTKELIQDSIQQYNENNGISPEFLTTLKTSPLNAQNVSYNPSITLDSWKNHVLGLCSGSGDNTLMKQQLLSSERLPEIIKGCMYNVSLYSTINIDSCAIPVKARFDAINPTAGYIIGLNLTYDASPSAFSEESAKNGYHIEAAFLMYLASELFNKSFRFYYLVQEQTAPFNYAKYKVSEQMRIQGEAEIVDLLAAATTIKRTKINPSYELYSQNQNGVIDLDLPPNYTPLTIHHL